MRRHGFNLLTVLSLLVIGGVTILLLDDDLVSREVDYLSPGDAGGGRLVGVYAWDTRIYFGVMDGRSGASMLSPGLTVNTVRGWGRSTLYVHFIMGHPRPTGFGLLDITNADASVGGDLLGWTGVRLRAVMIPQWSVLCLALVLPVTRAGRWWCRRGRGGPGRCQACGYDLTGNESGVCPECGRSR